MNNIKIIKLNTQKFNEAFDLIANVVKDSFAHEGLSYEEYADTIDLDLSYQKARLEAALQPQSTSNVFLIALKADKVVGTIGYGKNPTEIEDAFERLGRKDDLDKTITLYSSYILPKLQRQGIGSMLYKEVMRYIKNEKEVKYFAVETVYKKGVKFWQKVLGEPALLMENYYDDGFDCSVWINKI